MIVIRLHLLIHTFRSQEMKLFKVGIIIGICIDIIVKGPGKQIHGKSLQDLQTHTSLQCRSLQALNDYRKLHLDIETREERQIRGRLEGNALRAYATLNSQPLRDQYIRSLPVLNTSEPVIEAPENGVFMVKERHPNWQPQHRKRQSVHLRYGKRTGKLLGCDGGSNCDHCKSASVIDLTKNSIIPDTASDVNTAPEHIFPPEERSVTIIHVEKKKVASKLLEIAQRYAVSGQTSFRNHAHECSRIAVNNLLRSTIYSIVYIASLHLLIFEIGDLLSVERMQSAQKAHYRSRSTRSGANSWNKGTLIAALKPFGLNLKSRKDLCKSDGFPYNLWFQQTGKYIAIGRFGEDSKQAKHCIGVDMDDMILTDGDKRLEVLFGYAPGEFSEFYIFDVKQVILSSLKYKVK